MSNVIALSRESRNVSGKRNRTVGRQIVIGPNAIKFIAIAICAILAMVYLTQSTAGANRSVKVGDLETESTQLSVEKERLEVEQTRLQSLKEIENKIDKNALEAPGGVTSRPNTTPAP